MIEAIHPEGDPDAEGKRPRKESSIVSNVPPSPSADSGTNNCKDRTPWWKKLLEWTAVLTGVGLLLVNIGLWKATKKAADAAKQSTSASARAWIAPQNAMLSSEPVLDQPVTIEILYGNPGKEPALDVHPIFKIKPIAKARFDDNTFNSIVEADDLCHSLGTAPGADVIYPDQPGGYKLRMGLPPNWIKNDIVGGEAALVIEMCFAYKTLGEVHHTAFCYFYRTGTSTERQMNICTAGNHAD